jgi:hypothetical protein
VVAQGSVARGGRPAVLAVAPAAGSVGVLVSAGSTTGIAERRRRPSSTARHQRRVPGPGDAFDLLNGGCGMLNAAQVVGAMLQSGEIQAGMVVAGEANSDRRPDPASKIARSGAALLLELSPGAGSGFGAFAFRTHEDARAVHAVVSGLSRVTALIRRQRLRRAWLAHAAAVAKAARARPARSVDLAVPAQVRRAFPSRLPVAIGVLPEGRGLTSILPEPASTSAFLAWHHLAPGDRRHPAPGFSSWSGSGLPSARDLPV